MNNIQILILKNEIATDPLIRGYSGMNDQQIADSLNTVNRSVTTPFLTGVEIGNQIDVSEFNAVTVTNEQRNTLRSMWNLTNIPTESGFFRSYLLSVFGVGSVTRTNLIANFTHLESRAKELKLLTEVSIIGAHHVTNAKNFQG